MRLRIYQRNTISIGLHIVEYSHHLMTDSSRERLLVAAQRLFADRGFAATAVGDIEEAAGFTRRGGTFYRHFPSKQAVLTELIDRSRLSLSQTSSPLRLLPLGDVTAEMRLVARAVLAGIDTEEDIHRILDGCGDHAEEAREQMLANVVEPSYAAAAKILTTWGTASTSSQAEALVAILVGGLVNTRRNRWTFGRVPLNIADEQLVEAFVALVTAMRIAPIDSVVVKPLKKRTTRS